MSLKKSKTKKPFRRHFRQYRRSGHPAFIVGESAKDFNFHRVTSSTRSGHHSNWKIDPNPQIGRNTPMYIVKAEQTDSKSWFSNELPNFRKFDSSFIKRKSNKKTNKK